MNEIENIIDLAVTVRESTNKRLGLIPEGFEAWKIGGIFTND